MATSFYASSSDLANYWGSAFLQQVGDIDGDSSKTVARINESLVYADAIIDSKFMSVGKYTQSPHLSLGPISTVLCRNWACEIAGEWLYKSRFGRNEKYVAEMQSRIKDVMDDLSLAAAGAKSGIGWDASNRWPVSDAPVSVQPNESSPSWSQFPQRTNGSPR